MWTLTAHQWFYQPLHYQTIPLANPKMTMVWNVTRSACPVYILPRIWHSSGTALPALNWGEWLPLHASSALHRRKDPWYHFEKWLCGSQNLSTRMAKRTAPAGNQTPVAQPVASLYCLRHSCCLQLSQTNTVYINSFVRNLENKKTVIE